MYRKYFFKNKGVLSRRFVASGLAAVFSAGMFGSYSAEAMKDSISSTGSMQQQQQNGFNKSTLSEKQQRQNISTLPEQGGAQSVRLLKYTLDIKPEGDIFLKKVYNNVQDKKNKLLCKWKLIVTIGVVAIVAVFIIVFAIMGAVKGKSNTDNNNKDDEKIKPSTDPEIPSTDPENQSTNPESDNQNTEQKQESSVVPNNILKVIGTTVASGTFAGGGTYLFNEVSKRGKSSKVENPKNVNGEFMYLDSAGNKVTKTEEGRKDNYDNDDKNADNSGTKQLLEDKNAEKIEEEQEEILENSTLSDDTEATSDEDKNKD